MNDAQINVLSDIQTAPAAAQAAMLKAYITKVHDGKKPEEFGQAEHARFITFATTRIADAAGLELPAEMKQALYAFLSTNGAVNASQFRQHWSAEKQGGLIPPAKKTTISTEGLGF